jgi:hypothetical protein
MFLIWRRFIVWLRNLLLHFKNQDKIQWDEEIIEVTDIIIDAVDKKPTKPVEPTKPIEPIPKPTIPNYDIIGPVQGPVRRLWNLLRRKK